MIQKCSRERVPLTNSMDLGTPWVLRRLASSATSGSKIKLNIPPTVLLSNLDLDRGHHLFLHTGDDGRLRANGPPQDVHPRHEPDHYRLHGALEFIRQLNDGGSSCVVNKGLNAAAAVLLVAQTKRTPLPENILPFDTEFLPEGILFIIK